MALIDPANRIGSPGEDLLSRNCNWSLPLLALPGRAGLDLGLALSLNSLVYTRAGSVMHFDPIQGDPAPGFSLGFPEIHNAFINTEANVQSYLLSMPSGSRVEFRQVNTNVYEAVDSSYMLLTRDPVNSIFVLYTTDGTQSKFMDVTGSGDYKCVQIKDRHGNYITIGYGSLTEIRTVTDTLARVINFNYDVNNHLLSITQSWGGQTHTWATFAYGAQTIQTNFPGLTLNGTANGTQESVLTRVGLADGSIYSFEYNTYAQVKTVRRYAPNNSNPVNFPGDYFQRSYTIYGLPDNANSPQTDCPRITSRTDWASDWNSGVTSFYTTDPGHTWGQVTFPNGTIYKEFFAPTGWQRGLTTQTENWAGGVRKKWTTFQWTQDNTGVVYPLNPRVTETNVYDDANNRRRTKVDYISFGLVSDVSEYDSNTTTLIRRTHTDYNLSAVYTDRRIIGLPSAQYLYDGNNALFSKVTYVYDLNPNPNPYLQHPGPTAQHDTANYGSGFVQGRGNLNRKLRWDVTDSTNESQASEYETGYNTSGSVIFTRDPLNHQTDVSYTDSFSDGQNNRNTYAYPTTMTDPDTFSSTIKYNFDFGAVTWTQNPKGAAVTRTYDAAGRIERITNMVNGAYTRYVYSADQRRVATFTTINDLNPANEYSSAVHLDGHDRVRATSSDHPGSVGQFKAQFNVYDVMGRLAQKSNPTEINGSWQPVGDDTAWVWSSQSYDWQGRLTISTDQAGKTKEFLYGGCGCAGGQVVVTRDEVGRRQKMIYDILGRLKTTQALFIQPKNQPLDGNGAVYSTTTNTCNVRDQVTNVNVKDEASGVSQNTQMVYDGHGRLKERWLPIYLGNPQSATPYDSYEYYSDDTLMQVTDPRGASATYSYNDRRLMTSIVYGAPGGVAATPNVTFTYDENGNRIWMDDGPGYVSYVYDTLSRLQSETRHFDELTGDYQISYTYNLAEQIKTITDNRFNTTATYTYNKAGELTGIGGNGYGSSAQNNFTASSASIWYRAWGGTKQLNYGNGLQLNLNYNERLQPTQYRLQTGQSQVRDGSDYQYYDDGRVRFASNMVAAEEFITPANAFDRAYNYDHVGRLVEASTGPEARGETLPPSPPPPNNPYKQVNTYDVWGNLTQRANRFWRTYPSVAGTYSNNRRVGWQYDQAGNALIDTNEHTYDAASRQATMTGYDFVGGSQTGHPSMRSPEITQSYDGDGSPVKRIETRRTEEYIDGGPQTEITTWVTTTYYVRPRALGGQVMLEIESSIGPNLNINVNKSYVYSGNERIAESYNLYSGGPYSIAWRHSNPVTGTLLKTNESGFVNDRSEFDPFGAEVGSADPYYGDEFADYIEIKGQEPLYIEGGNPFDLSGGCSLDGMPVPCGFAMGAANAGAAAQVQDGQTKRFRDGRLEYFHAFANGTQGYLPVGANLGCYNCNLTNDPPTTKPADPGTIKIETEPAYGPLKRIGKKIGGAIGRFFRRIIGSPTTTTRPGVGTVVEAVVEELKNPSTVAGGIDAPVLPDDIVATFAQGTISPKYLEVETTYFRYFGDEEAGESPMIGRFLANREYATSEEAIIKLALDQTWAKPNPATRVVNVVLPAGTLIYGGVVAPQGDHEKYPGGGYQIFVPNIWNIPGIIWGTPRPVGR
jgi:hypothetical protein